MLAWLVLGGTNRQIGVALHVSPRTVEKHVERILTKLGAANRTIAALRAGDANSKPNRTMEIYVWRCLLSALKAGADLNC